jgi:hypothetical protein
LVGFLRTLCCRYALTQLAQFGSGFRNFAQAGMNEIK